MGDRATIRVTVNYNRLPQIRKAFPTETSKALRKCALRIERDSKMAAPVDTGTLKGSIGTEGVTPGSMKMSVFTACGYGAHVNFGTRRMSARPFMTDAAQKAGVTLRSDLERLKGRL